MDGGAWPGVLPNALQKCGAYVDVQGTDPKVGVQPCDCLQLIASKPERLQVYLQHNCGMLQGLGTCSLRQVVSTWLSPTSQTPARAQYLCSPGKSLCNLRQDNTVGGWGKVSMCCLLHLESTFGVLEVGAGQLFQRLREHCHDARAPIDRCNATQIQIHMRF